jgi:hypothetical protein
MKVSLATLHDFDMGKIDLSMQQHLKRCVEDCMDRPANGGPRTVTLKLKLTPQCDERGDCESANLEFTIGSSIPDHVSRTYSCGVKRGGHLEYSQLFPDTAAAEQPATLPLAPPAN